MPFFSLVVVAVLERLPDTKLVWRLRAMFDFAKRWEALRQWHKAELERMDPTFALELATRKLMLARQKAYEDGISPLDPLYPTLWDFAPPLQVNPKDRQTT